MPIMLHELGKSKISNMSIKMSVQQYVVWLDIPMDDQRGTITVQIAKSFCSFCVYFEPSVLLEKLTPLPIQHFSQPSIWHVMINKQCFNFCRQAISPKLGRVRPFIFTSTTVVLATILQTLSMFLIFLTLLLTLYTNLDATWIYLNMGIF